MFKTLQMSLNLIHVTMQWNRGPVIAFLHPDLVFSRRFFFSVCGLIEKLSLSKMPFEDDPVISESIKPLYICSFKNLLYFSVDNNFRC